MEINEVIKFLREKTNREWVHRGETNRWHKMQRQLATLKEARKIIRAIEKSDPYIQHSLFDFEDEKLK